MGRDLRDLTVETLCDVPARCRACVFWEMGPAARADAFDQDPAFEKEAWCSEVGLLAGACGKVVYVDGRPVGFALYGTPDVFPGATAFPARISKDALLLATLTVEPEVRGAGVARLLVQAALKDAKARGKRAVEAFGDRRWNHPACVMPAVFLETVGFTVKREHPRYPLMRLDVRSLAKLTESVAAAVEELLESVRAPAPAARPAP